MTYPELPEPDGPDVGQYTEDTLLAYGKAVQEWAAKLVKAKREEIEDMPTLAADMLAQAIREGKP